MNKKELVNMLFYTAYHSGTMWNSEVRKFLMETFPLIESKHLDAMRHFLNRLSECKMDNENSFILGMLCEAWKQLLDEQFPNQKIELDYYVREID